MMKSFTIAATLLALAGGASFTRTEGGLQQFALTLSLTSAAVAITNEVSSRATANKLLANQKEAFELIIDDKERLKSLNVRYKNAVTETKRLYELQTTKLTETKQALDVYEQQIRNIKSDFQHKMDMLTAKFQMEDTRFTEMMKKFRSALLKDVAARIDKLYNDLDTNIQHKLNKKNDDGSYQYAKVFPALKKLNDYLEQKFLEHSELLKDIAAHPTDDTIIDALGVYSIVCDEMVALKVKYRNTLNIDEKLSLNNAYETLGSYSSLHVPKAKVASALEEMLHHSTSSLEPLKSRLAENDVSLAEIRVQVGDLLNQIEADHLVIDGLNQQVALLKMPHRFVGVMSQASVGNVVMDYYFRAGIVLDGAEWQITDTGYRLVFYKDRNARHVDLESLNAAPNPDKLKEVSGAINTPTFKQSDRSSCIHLDIQQTYPIKKTLDDRDIDKIWVSSDQFETFVRRWERVRITAGSTGGKSPTAKNLALAIMHSRGGKGSIKLYDPQHGSKKDFWGIPKTGKSHNDSVTGMMKLNQLLDARTAAGSAAEDAFILYIFDELDSTISKFKDVPKDEKVPFSDLINYTLKQASHQNIGAIYIGQSSDANEVPGMTWTDWQNAVQLHIGGNAALFLNKAQAINSEDRTRLLDQYKKLQEYCEGKNKELGLDVLNDAKAFRFALAVPQTGLPRFIQLPDYDTYNYEEVMGEVSPAEAVKCPYCGSLDTKKDGKNRDGGQLYSCKTCETKPKKFVAE